jgi:hypothetical protein
MINPRQAIVSFMRGLFICPIIAFLLKNNLIKIFSKKKFSLNDFKTIKNKEFFYNILLYLQNLGLIKSTDRTKKNFKTTKLGKKIFLRSGSFLILHSYKSFIDNLDKTLFKNQVLDNMCDRKENIIGSGSIHKKKFFPKAFSMIKRKDVGLIVDIGCGDGNFLIEASKKFKNVPILASDFSHLAVKETKKNLKNLNCKKLFITCDAFNVKKWSKEVNKIKLKKNKKIIISLWFILHEISKGKPQNIIIFFRKLKKFLPKAQIIIGEIIEVPTEMLSKNMDISIMPEFLFFHQLSDQGVLKYSDYKKIQSNIPQTLDKEIKFDLVKHKNKTIPSAFIWSLKN